MPYNITICTTLISRLIGGDETAFRAIYDKMHPRIYRMLLALTKDTARAEELLQETFVDLWQHRERLDATKPLYPYVYLNAKRLAIDHFRRCVLEAKAIGYLTTVSMESANTTEESVVFADLNRLAEESINNLPKQQRTVFFLSRNEGLSYEEIAHRLHISPHTVRNHMVCALRTLRLTFGKHDFFY